MKSLLVIKAILQYSKPIYAIKSLITTIIPYFASENLSIRDLAFECLAVYSLIDLKISKEYFDYFSKILEENIETITINEIELIAIKAIFDNFLMFDLLKNDENSDYDNAYQYLINFALKCEESESLELCITGLCRLSFADRIPNQIELLSYLFLLWHDSIIIKKGRI